MEFGINQIAGEEPTPESLAQLNEEHRRLLDMLRDDTLRDIALSRMEGYSSEEIADRLGVSPRTVRRKLRVIRSRWSKELDR